MTEALPRNVLAARDEGPTGDATQRHWDWRPLALVALTATLLFTLSSFTPRGEGLFGWAGTMDTMWLWALVPSVLVALLVFVVLDTRHRRVRI